MASLAGDCKRLTLGVISALVNAKDAESQLIIAQNDLAAAQSKLTVSKEELATTSHELAAAKKYATEKDQQLLNVLAEIKKRESPNDDIIPPAERVLDGEEMDSQKAITRFEEQKCRFDETKKRKSSNDANIPPAKKVHDEEEMDHRKALAVFEGQNRRFDEIKKQ
ncbi:hypothetical protein G6514_002498 [Epicoccum nigrum]|nr:hypothetical protein G6514_002498 [Epicoccum nigrum]